MKKLHSLPIFFLTLVLLVSALAPAYAAEEPFSVTAAAAILVDADYDEVLWEYHADDLRYPASITKVMTGLLTVEAIDRGELAMDTLVTLGDDLYTGIGEGGSSQGLKVGEILTIRDLLNCALIPSANEACNALAGAVAGSIPAFVDRMNTRCAELGMTNTHFVNTHGYHDDNHYTTARDISRMCLEAMKHPEIREIVSSTSYTVPATHNAAGEVVHASWTVHDTNALVSNHRSGRADLLYRYAIGIKTGSTPEAGMCLASAAEKNGRTMIAVLLGGKNYQSKGERIEDNYFSESKRMLEYGFNQFSRKTVLDVIEPIATIPVSLCAQQNYVTVQPAHGIEATLLNTLDPTLFERVVEVPEELQAPIEKGATLGSIHITYQGRDYGTVDLVAATGLERSQWLYTLSRIQFWFDKLWVKLALLAVILLLLLLVLRRIVFGPSTRRSRRGSSPRVYSTNYRGRRR